MFLGECSASHTEHPRGLSLFSISAQMGRHSSNAVRLSAIKLIRLGYIDKTVEVDNNNGDDYYAYSITEDGLDVYLQNEAAFKPPPPPSPAPRPAGRPAPNFSDMDDEVPF